MKGSILIVLVAFAFGSCKKNHICFCTQDNFPDKTLIIKDTKKKAKIKCDNETKIFDTSYAPEPNVIGHYNCKLK